MNPTTSNTPQTPESNNSKLVNCPICERKISSEAPTCPQCGHPMAGHSKNPIKTVESQSNSSNAGLGIFFIILGIIGAIGGLFSMPETEYEKLQKSLMETQERGERENQKFAGSPEFRNSIDSQELFLSGARRNREDRREEERKLYELQSQRHTKMAFWFVPGGVLLVLGLILKSKGMTEKFAEPPRLSDNEKGVLDFVMLQFSKVNLRRGGMVLGVLVVAVIIWFVVSAMNKNKNADPSKDLPPARYLSPTR